MTRATRCSEWVASQVQSSSEVFDRSLSPYDNIIEPTPGRQRKRNIASLENDGPESDSTCTPKPARKRPRRHEMVHDDVDGERDESMSAAASSSASTETSGERSRRSASPMKHFNRLAAQPRPTEKLSFNQLDHCPLPEMTRLKCRIALGSKGGCPMSRFSSRLDLETASRKQVGDALIHDWGCFVSSHVLRQRRGWSNTTT